MARASTLLFPWTSSLLSWLMAWFFFSACSLFWFCLVWTGPPAAVGPPLAASTAPGLAPFCRRGPVLGLDRDPVLALKLRPEAAMVPGPVLVVSAAGSGRAGVAGPLAFTRSGTYKEEKHHLTSLLNTTI